jgi:hypothetical protein
MMIGSAEVKKTYSTPVVEIISIKADDIFTESGDGIVSLPFDPF